MHRRHSFGGRRTEAGLLGALVAAVFLCAGCGSKLGKPLDCPALTQASTDGGPTFTCPETVADYCATPGVNCPTFDDTASLCKAGMRTAVDCGCYHVAYMQGVDSSRYLFFDSNGTLFASLGGLVTGFGCGAGPHTFTWPSTCPHEKDTAICK